MKMRFYQEEIIKSQREFMANDEVQRGQVYSPTGSGKTVCFDASISEIIEGNSDKKICIVYPRIALAMDQQGRLKDKLNVEFTSFHSGGVDAPEDAKKYREQVSTTSVEELRRIRETTKMNHITSTTYHSFPLIAKEKFDLIICDEAHNLVQRNFAEALPLIESKVLFYTATPINVINGVESVIGMNNEKLFGKPICHIKPKELIDKGYIVPPRLVEMNISTDENGITVRPYLAIAHVFADLKTRLTTVNNKLLVSMSDTKDFDDIQDNVKLMKTYTGDIDLYTIKAGEQVKNGKKLKSRELALKDFANNKKQCIIVHCDTLAEGIDVPGITASYIYRYMSKAKLIQTVGRAARPSLEDMDEKTGEVIDMNNRVKPNCYVYIAVIDNEYYANLDVKTVCEAFIEGGYGESMKDITTFIEKERVDVDSKANALLQQNTQSIAYMEIEKVVAKQVVLDVMDDWSL